MKLQSFWQESKNRVNILEEFSYVAKVEKLAIIPNKI
jgi:hypothetical protein